MKFLGVFLLFAVASGIKIKCLFTLSNTWQVIGRVYTCQVIEMDFTDHQTEITSYTGTHLGGNSSAEVKMVHFPYNYCPKFDLKIVPKGFSSIFPNIIGLYFQNCSIDTLNGDELVEYPNLEYFLLQGLKLAVLEKVPGNLFASTPKMSFIFFGDNKINRVGEGLLDGLRNLQEVYFNNNVCIDKIAFGMNYVPDLIEVLRQNCSVVQATTSTTVLTTTTTTTTENPTTTLTTENPTTTTTTENPTTTSTTTENPTTTSTTTTVNPTTTSTTTTVNPTTTSTTTQKPTTTTTITTVNPTTTSTTTTTVNPTTSTTIPQKCEIDDIEQFVCDLDKEVENLKNVVKNLKNDTQNLNEKSANLSNQVYEFDEVNNDFNNQIKLLDAENKDLTSTVEFLKLQNQDIKVALGSGQNRIDDMEKSLKDLIATTLEFVNK